MNYHNNIFCIIDKDSFSASLTFASLKNYIKNFYVVGSASPYYGGFSLTPLFFMLPSSKLLLRLVSTSDYNLLKSGSYRVIPDIIVKETPSEILKDQYKLLINYNSKKYSGLKNKYIKKIIEFENIQHSKNLKN